jgi:molybdenum cofactor biosynthesis enzyme MoaA
MLQDQVEDAAILEQPEWPPEVGLIISALEAGDHHEDDRRQVERGSYRVVAQLRLFSDPPGSEAWTLYSRDASPRGMGFITPHQLPLGHGGMIEFVDPYGNELSINCTLYRCRLAAPGWFEGALYFNRDQWVFQELIDQQSAVAVGPRLVTDKQPARR